MNDDPENRDKLVGEIYHGDWANGSAARFAQEAAHHARQVRRQRLTVAGLAMGALVAVIVFAPFRPVPIVHPGSPALAKAPANPPPAYEIISDQELLAQVRDRPLLAIHENDATLKITVLPN